MSKKTTWTPPSVETMSRERMETLQGDPNGLRAGQSFSVIVGTPGGSELSMRREAINEAMALLEKDVRVSAKRQSKTELLQWVAVYVANMTQDDWERSGGLEFDLRDEFSARYWERLAELAGI